MNFASWTPRVPPFTVKVRENMKTAVVYLVSSNIMELTYRKASCTEPEKRQVRQARFP